MISWLVLLIVIICLSQFIFTDRSSLSSLYKSDLSWEDDLKVRTWDSKEIMVSSFSRTLFSKILLFYFSDEIMCSSASISFSLIDMLA